MAVEKMQFSVPMIGNEGFPFTVAQGEKEMQFSMPMVGDEGFPFTVTQGEKEAAVFSARAAEAAILKARAGAAILKAKAEKEAAIHKAKAKAEKEAAILKAKAEKEAAIHKAKAKAEKEAAILKAKAEAAIIKAKAETEEEGVIEAYYDPEEDDVPYEKLCDGYNSDEDVDSFMARMEARWNSFIKDEEARFPGLGYREYSVGEYSVDDSSDSDDEQEYYLRKLEASHGVEGCEIAALVI